MLVYRLALSLLFERQLVDIFTLSHTEIHIFKFRDGRHLANFEKQSYCSSCPRLRPQSMVRRHVVLFPVSVYLVACMLVTVFVIPFVHAAGPLWVL